MEKAHYDGARQSEDLVAYYKACHEEFVERYSQEVIAYRRYRDNVRGRVRSFDELPWR